MTQMPWRRIPSLPRDRWGNWTQNASSGCFTRGDLRPAQPCPGEELGEQGARQSLADSRPFKTRDERPESGTQQCITFESQKRPPHWGRGSAGASMSYRGHSPRRHSSAKLARPLASWSTRRAPQSGGREPLCRWCSASPPRPKLTRSSPKLRGDALHQSSHQSTLLKMKHFSQPINRRAG